MTSFSVTPSSYQVNEGDSLSTSLAGFTPGSTVYFKAGGRGINKKDFAAGGMKGSIKVNANGMATISHTLRADKKTEGEESFSIQVFSDKKMRNPLGQSDSVSVLDTSVKAGKPPKGVGSGGGSTIVNDFRIKALLTGQIVTSDTVNTGFFTPATDKNRSYANAQYEIEANQSKLILTLRADNYISAPRPERFTISRTVLTGNFKSDESGNLSGTVDRITSFAIQSDSQRDFFMETAQSYTVAKGTNISNSLAISPSRLITATYFYSNYSDVGFDTDGRFADTPRYGNRVELKGLPDTDFFQQGWWQDPFTPNLI